MAVAILVPYRETDEHRVNALRFVCARYREHFADCRLGIGGDTHGDPLWRKGAVVGWLVDKARIHLDAPDVLVISDADVVADLGALRTAIDMVESGVVEWAVPHMWVHRLDEFSTDRVYERPAIFPPMHRRLDRGPYRGVVGGGITVVRASLYADVPIDPRFHTWGSEDTAWGMALSTIAGPAWQSPDADLWHLWHPHAVDKPTLHPIDHASTVLLDQYRRAIGYPDRMAEVIAPARTVAGLSSDSCPDSSSA